MRPRTHQSLAPTVKVFFNIGSGRIGTLLFFVINLTLGKTVRTGSGVKVYATGKVSHDRQDSESARRKVPHRTRWQKTADFSGGDRSVSRERRERFLRASGGKAAFGGDDSDDGDAGTTIRDDGLGRRAWRSTDGRQDLASRDRASTVLYCFT